MLETLALEARTTHQKPGLCKPQLTAFPLHTQASNRQPTAQREALLNKVHLDRKAKRKKMLLTCRIIY